MISLTLPATVSVESCAGALAAEAAVAHLDAHAAVLAGTRLARVVGQGLPRCNGNVGNILSSPIMFFKGQLSKFGTILLRARA